MTLWHFQNKEKPARARWRVGLALLLSPIASAQVNTSPLQYVQTIIVPTWTNTGSSQANSDIFAFNPLTHMLYVADRTNHSVDAIDTTANIVVGVMTIPGAPSTNGVLIAPDLQQMVVTDGKTNVFVYDLRLPGGGPDQYNLPNIGGGTDALDYDPLNHTVYVINGTAPYYITGIDLVKKVITSQLKLPGSPELMRWNPNDGLIYQVITDGDNMNVGAGVAIYDPVKNSIKPTWLTPGCVAHGIEIDAVTNTALLGCGPGAQMLLNLTDGSILKTFAEVNTSDLIGYNPNTRRFYTGSSGNTSTLSGCPVDSSKLIPVVGVFDAKGAASAGTGRVIGVQCSGRNAKGPGIDPLQNYIYVATRQYPVDPNDPNTGQAGILVYWDPSGSTQPPTTQTQATLVGGGITGSVQMTLRGRAIRAAGAFQGIGGTTAVINITTTVGNEAIGCAVNTGGTTHCDGNLIGDPLIGGSVLLGVDGALAAQGAISGS
jgi:hypothetical protein